MPPFPSGRRLSLLEDADIDDDDYEVLADAISVGGSLWPSAGMLCRYLMNDISEEIRGSSVMELGSGTGACGLFAAGLGASRVLLTDGSAALKALQMANIESNRHLFAEGTVIEAETHLWGQPLPSEAAHNFDFVIGSDLSALAALASPPFGAASLFSLTLVLLLRARGSQPT
jgi:predicted nicotinamide N-methyase